MPEAIPLDQPSPPPPARVTNPVHDPDAMNSLGAPDPTVGKPKPPTDWWFTIAEWTDGNGVNEKIQSKKHPGGMLVRSLQVWKNRDGLMRRNQGLTFVPDKGK